MTAAARRFADRAALNVGDIDTVIHIAAGLFGCDFSLQEWLEEQFGKRIIGPIGADYGQFFALRDVWNNVHWAASDIKDNLTAGLNELRQDWQGNAAECFEERYMAAWNEALTGLMDGSASMRDCLDHTGHVCEHILDVVADIIGLMGGEARDAIKVLEKPWKIADVFKSVKNMKELFERIKAVSAVLEPVFNAIETICDIAGDMINDPGQPKAFAYTPSVYLAPTV